MAERATLLNVAARAGVIGKMTSGQRLKRVGHEDIWGQVFQAEETARAEARRPGQAARWSSISSLAGAAYGREEQGQRGNWGSWGPLSG